MKSKMDGESLAEGLKRLQASYPGMKPLDPMNVAAYAEGLSDYDGRDFIEATKRVVKTCRYFPSIAEIIDVLVDVAAARRGRENDERRRREAEEYAAEPKMSAEERSAMLAKFKADNGL